MFRHNATPMNLTEQVAQRQALMRAFLITAIVMLFMMAPDFAHAQSSGGGGFNFPVVDDLICGFISYSKGKLAPLIAAAVIIFAILGQWLGMGKMWGTLMYVGIGLGVILGIMTFIGKYAQLPANCV